LWSEEFLKVDEKNGWDRVIDLNVKAEGGVEPRPDKYSIIERKIPYRVIEGHILWVKVPIIGFLHSFAVL
jgi:hypothetical protein